MIPIPDIAVVEPGDVLHHPERGFAVVEEVSGERVLLRWEGRDARERVAADAVAREFRLCAPSGFLARSVLDRAGLAADATADPVGTLRVLLHELGEPQGRKDIQRWLVQRAGLDPVQFERWWDRLREQIAEAPDIRWQGDQIIAEPPADDEDGGAGEPGGAGTRLAGRTPAERFRRLLAAPTGDRAALIGEAVRAGDADAALLLLRGESAVPGDHAEALLRLALDGPARLLAALVDRGHEPATAALAELLLGGEEAARARGRAALSALRLSRRVPLLLDLVADALERGAEDEAARLVELLPGGPEHALAGVTDGRYAPRAAGRDWARALDWLRARAEEGPAPRTRAAPPPGLVRERPLPAERLFDVSAALARALAARHAAGETGGLAEARMVDGGDVVLGPPVPADPAQDVHDAVRLVLELAIGVMPDGVHVDGDALLAHLAELVPGLPPEWAAVATRALAAEPELRPANGLELWAQLERARALAAVRERAPHHASALLEIGHDTHIGRVKARLGQVNQDALFWHADGPLSLLVVADGISVSTAGSGNLASAILVQVLASLWTRRADGVAEGGEDAAVGFLVEALAQANRAICEGSLRLAGGDLSRHIPMGTTALVAVVRGNRVHLASLGDSRAYLVTAAGPAQLTGDHNLRGEWLRSWQQGEPIELRGQGHALTRYCGHFDEDRPLAVPPTVRSFTLLPGETLLLCTDGFSDYAAGSAGSLARILEEAAAAPDLEATCRALVDRANAGGGGDNITILAARLAR